METRTALAVAVGGVAGAALRWGLVESVDTGTSWPWATFLANVVGCLVLGGLVGRFQTFVRTGWFVGATTGFCGALTTFSAFAVELAGFVRVDRWGLLLAYMMCSVGAGLASFLVGRQLGSQP